MGSDEKIVQEVSPEINRGKTTPEKHEDISQIERVLSDASELKKDHTVRPPSFWP